jgi:hypothetical protein
MTLAAAHDNLAADVVAATPSDERSPDEEGNDEDKWGDGQQQHMIIMSCRCGAR